jgi:ABC-type branched-subunit amino acid transport system ATPase component/ABC-type branched-subunit amino acid transport system permease subunit
VTIRRAPAVAVAAAIVALLAFPLASPGLYYENMAILTLLLAIGASSWNVVAGYAGYVSLGQGVFLGIGGYTVAILASRTELSPFVFVPLAGIVSALCAGVVGAVLMRTRGHAFVILTIAFLFFMQILVLTWPSLTEGSTGITLPLPQWDRDLGNWPFYYLLLALLLMTVAMSWWIRRTKFGAGLLAIREDEDKAATVGVRLPVYKVLAFVLSAVFVGMAGGVYAYYLTFIEPVSMFDIVLSVQIVLAALLGGAGTLLGPVLGAAIIEPLFQVTNNEIGGGNWRLVISGTLMALVVILLPQGIVPSVRERLARRSARRGGATAAGSRLPELRPGSRPGAGAPASRRTGEVLLEVKGLQKRFGGVTAVDGCSLSVEEGSITGLIGPNGSGKTTLFNLVGGSMRPDAGEVWFDGTRIDGLPPWRRAYLGLGRTFQITRVFPQMTVLENVVAPLRRFSWAQLRAGAMIGSEMRRADEWLDFVGMREFRDQPAQALSYGQRKLVELAQVLMLEPKLILLDEPAGGINPTLVERIAGMIRELGAQGTTFLIVEHNMPLVLDLCDPVLVLAEGTCIYTGAPSEVQRDPRVLDAYLGEDFRLEDRAEA